MSTSLFGLIFGGVGVASLVIAGFLYLRQRDFLSKAQLASGVVTSLRTSRDDDGQDMFAPVVDFRTQTGQQATYQSSLYSRPCKYKVGDPVELLYNPDKPSDAQIKGRSMNYLPMLIVGGLGVVFALVGVIMFAIPQR